MHHGHHGVNQPVKNLVNNSIEITSQNHGFKIEEKSLPSDLKVSHYSLFDGVIQGIEHKKIHFLVFNIILSHLLAHMTLDIYLVNLWKL